MTTQLDWVADYNHSPMEYRASYKGLRIRAIHDDVADNPFETSDCCWPIMVLQDDHRKVRTYEFSVERSNIYLGAMMVPLSNDQLVHDQRAVASIFGYDSIERLMVDCDVEDPVVYCTDAVALRTCFEEVLHDLGAAAQMAAWEQMFRLAGVPVYSTTVRGYSQSDWAEVLVVATPEAMEKFGVNFEEYRAKAKAHPSIKQVMAEQQNLDAWIFDKACELMLAHTADLYGHWAFGDVYGYIVEKRTGHGVSIFLDQGGPQELFVANFEDLEAAEDFLATSATIDPDLLEAGNYSVVDYEDPDAYPWEEIPDGSCWGYFGPDFDKSGLEDDAISVADSYLDHHAQEMTDA